jgi:hypothetical protein
VERGLAVKCFNHEDRDALGICKICQKGGCRECINDTDSGIACKDTCEKILKNFNIAALCMKVFGAIFFLIYIIFLLITLSSPSISGGMADSLSICFLVVCMILYIGMMNHIPARRKKAINRESTK